MSAPVTTAEEAQGLEQGNLNDKLASTSYFDTVSKRSVERHYYPQDPQYLRHFVKKPQRRSALLNRLYCLRSKALHNVVLRFLAECTEDTPKVVISLGCGSDVLPWTLNHRYQDMCKNARFIDIDLPSVISSKRSTILQTPALLELLGDDYHTSKQDCDALMLQSAKYCQIGCDFTNRDLLRNTAGSLITSGSKVLVVAEMSLMYNDVKSTDSLLSWARTQLQADFCLLEHCFPAGMDHPLAVKLLQDYEKGQTPLRTIHTYPTAGSQYQRFKDLRWKEISTWDLWEIWTRDEFIDSVERAAINRAEPFDDWEDLILLARHFFVLSASDRVRHDEVSGVKCAPAVKPREASCVFAARQSLAKNLRRKFGGLVCDTTAEGAELAMHMLGESSTGLSDNYDALTFSSGKFTARLPTSGPSPRSCFTVTDLDHAGVIVIGGRSTAMNKPLSDCWIYHRGPSPYWKKTWDLPNGIYRHSAIRLGRSSMILVMGGKSARGVSPECFVFHPDKGWHRCAIGSPYGPSLFGASIWQTQLDGPIRVGNFQGVYCGGLNAATKPNLDMFRWHLETTTSESTICFETINLPGRDTSRIALFGTTVVTTPTQALLIGGVGIERHSDYLGQSIVEWPLSDDAGQLPLTHFPFSETNGEWPLMVGSSAISCCGRVIVLGGGAAAYLQGSLWTDGLYVFDFETNASRSPPLDFRLLESPKLTSKSTRLHEDSSAIANIVALTPVPRIRLKSSEDFRTVLLNRKPVIIESLDLGTCLDKWTPQYLCDQVGVDTKVTVHESTSDSPRLDFNSKNFKYVTESLGKVISKMQVGGRMYLRALSRSKPSDIPANLEDDFPSLAPDFQLPKELDLANDSVFSSILRLSGRANMWLHYDVMANIYTQIRGTKQMILFPPRDATRLDFAPGASSSSFDVFSAIGTKALAGTHPFEAILGAGDALFLPAAWLHAASPRTDMSVAVNVFFRDLDGGYAEGRDVYGNRDLAAYEKGRLEAARIAQAFGNVPQDMRQFYLSRIAEELRQLAETT